MRARLFLLLFALSIGAAQAASPLARDVDVTTVQTVVLRVRQRTESGDEKKTSTERSSSRKENSDTIKTTKTPSATRKSSTLSSRTSTPRSQLTATGTPHSSIDPSTSGPFPIETSSSPEPTSEPPPSPPKKKSKGPMLAGILISLVGAIVILVSALLYLRRRKRRVTAFHSGKTQIPGQGIAYDELRTTSGNHVAHERWYSPLMTRTKKMLGREDARLRDVKSAEEYRYSELPELVAVERINVRSP